MTKSKDIVIGLFSPLFYFLVGNIMRYTIFLGEYNAKYALPHNMLITILPALPGVALMFLLIRDSMTEFFKSLTICFWISFAIMVIYIFSGIDFMIYTAITGYEEMGLGDGLIAVVTMLYYIVSCLVGAIVAGVATHIRKRK